MIRKMVLLSVAAMLMATCASATETVIKSEPNREATATLVFSALPLQTMTEIPFSFTIDENGNKDIKTAACDLSMPAMPMPENRPDLVCSGNKCTGKAIFTMAGKWQATFGLLMSDGSHTSIVFDIDMVKMK